MSKMRTSRTRVTRCPACGAEIDAATNTDNSKRRPARGDASLCLKCGEWLIYINAYQLRLPTSDELALLRADPRCQKVRQAWQMLMEDARRDR